MYRSPAQKQTGNLSTKLKAYSALTGSLLAITPAILDAQIIYTDIDPDFTDANDSAFYALDLNNDGTTDFKISISSDGVSAVKMTAGAMTGNAIAGTHSSAYMYPSALDLNEIIGSNRSWNAGTGQTMASAGYYMNPYGFWFGAIDKYLALRISLEGSDHYGWLRLDVSQDGHSFIVKDYAYQTSPGMKIFAGYFCSIVPLEPTIILNGSSLMCNESADAYQWFLNAEIIDGATNQIYTPTQNGMYTVKVTNVYGCTNVSANFDYILSDIAPVDGAALNIYSAEKMLFVQLNSEKYLGGEMKILNVIGKEIYSAGVNEESIHLDLNQLTAGMYTIAIEKNGSRVTKKIVVD